MVRVGREGGRFVDVRSFIGELYGPGLHAKRIDSLAGATLGTMTAASLAVALIGQALAQARGLKTKHAIKQVDRLLSNEGIDVWDSFTRWVPHQIGDRRENFLVAMDWTDFDHDDQATLVLSLVTGHGRAAPLLWLTVWKEELKNHRNATKMPACGGCPNWCQADAGSPSWPIAVSAIRSYSPTLARWASTTSSVSVATSMSPMPTG